MTLGTGIFLSALMLSMVIMYVVTRDRWSWKKISIRTFVVLLSVGVLVAVAIWVNDVYQDHQNRAVAQTEFYGIKLSDTQSDIKFIKGAPLKEEDGMWVYRGKRDKGLELVIIFQDNNIRSILYIGDCTYCTGISGLGIGDSYEDVIAKFGEPSNISISRDELQRMLSFEKYNVIFEFRKNRVNAFGIHNFKYGNYEFKNEKK